MDGIDAGPAVQAKRARAKTQKASSGAGPAWAQVLIIVAAIAIAGGTVWSLSGGGNALEAGTKQRAMIDAQSGQVFEQYTIRDGDTVPFTNPKTGEATLYPAETCYWTRDGKAKAEPTYVLLNGYTGSDEPTMCPDCGRRVVPHNPPPPPEAWADVVAELQGGKKP
jgi:hypothetical protein